MRKLAIIIIIILLTLYGAGCTGVDTGMPDTQDINPKAEAAGKDTMAVTLYYSYRGDYMLAGETRTIDVPVSDTLEAAVVRALIDGPSADRDELVGLFWDDVELVRTETNGDYLLVTLGETFVSSDRKEIALEDADAAQQKRLAIMSIVNTIVEMGTYSRVQILVDREGGIGQRITMEEAGWIDGGGKRLEPRGRDESLILTPENTVAASLDAYGKKDWMRLYNFTAHISPDGAQKPEIQEFSDALTEAGNKLESFSVQGHNVSYDGQTAVVMLDYAIKTREGQINKLTNKPVVLVREKDIWKLSYHSLIKMLLNV